MTKPMTKSITKQEFLKRLKAVNIHWRIDYSGAIRGDYECCPLAAVAGIQGTNDEKARRVLGLRNRGWAAAVVAAADLDRGYKGENNIPIKYDPEFRLELLKACRLI